MVFYEVLSGVCVCVCVCVRACAHAQVCNIMCLCLYVVLGVDNERMHPLPSPGVQKADRHALLASRRVVFQGATQKDETAEKSQVQSHEHKVTLFMSRMFA